MSLRTYVIIAIQTTTMTLSIDSALYLEDMKHLHMQSIVPPSFKISLKKFKVARLPVIYMGRSVGPSHSYSNWHPIEMLFSNPDHLYHQYGKYRQILAEYTLQKGNTTYSKDKILKLIDFIHFSYMSEFFTHPIMNFLTEQTMTDTPLEQTMQKLWPIIIEAQNTKLKENPPPNESPGLFKKLLKSNSHIPTLTIQEFYQGSFLFGGTFIKKAKNEFPDDFNQVTLNISKNLENYKRSEEGIVS